jgi:predicted DCC family thiol-disulfide oxidoreductase YuxK
MKQALEKPVLIYDGECRFCCKWIERWREMTGDAVDYRPSQEAADEFPEICREEFAGAVQWVEPDGSRARSADAVFRALATSTRLGKGLLWLYRRVPPFAWASETFYRLVAKNRPVGTLTTALLWGRTVRRPTYAVSSSLFFRLLALVYLIAFLSFGAQADGLIGSRGILPIAELMPRVSEAFGAAAVWKFPTLCWFGAGDAALSGMAWAGAALSLVAMIGIAQPAVFLLLFVLHLSLVTAGQVFYQFQWDSLLLETGFLAILLAPWSWRPRLRGPDPSRWARLLLWWLLFRFMVASGVVKLSSGDPVWADGTALAYHYFTQPLPTPLAWYANQLPMWFQTLSVQGMFFTEMYLPVLMFLPRNPRLIAAAGMASLQVAIALTGNYGYFNLLVLMLILLLVDDAAWGRLGKKVRNVERGMRESNQRFLPRWILAPVAAVLFVLSLAPFIGAFRRPVAWLEPVERAYSTVAPFRIVNGYGLFAVMTTRRPEIIVQGSDDGFEWKTYSFKYKPGVLDRPPPWVAPYMPRLDWQMWFAALGDLRTSPWFVNFAWRLLQAEPEVLALLDRDPFDGRRPRYLRAQLDDYTFTTWNERKDTGNWWKAEPVGRYLPEVTESDFNP